MQSTPQLHNVKLQTEYVATANLVPMPGAPRQHPKSQIRSLAKSLEAFGQVLPILIDSEGRIISGHALWQAATRLGMTEVMAIRIEHLDEARIKALSVALNQLDDLSKWDEPKLNAILLSLQDSDLKFDIKATGFTLGEIELRIEGLGEPASKDDEVPVVGDGPAITRQAMSGNWANIASHAAVPWGQ